MVKLDTLSLSCTLSLSLSCSLSFLFSFPFAFPFFFSYLSSSLFFFFFFFSCSFSYSCSCSCSFSFSSFFFLPFYSLFSSLPFTPTNIVQSTDQQTRRPTLRRLNVMWRTVRSQQLPTNCTECSHLSSSLSLPPPSLPHQEKERELFITGIFPATNFIFITVLNKFQKIAAGENYSHYSFILIQTQKGCNCNHFAKRWYAHEVHLDKCNRARDFGLEFWYDVQ